MKHNNSNQSISGKKFMGGSIKKHGDGNQGPSNPSGSVNVVGGGNIGGGPGGGSSIGIAGGVVTNPGGPGGAGKKNYMSPYS